MYKNQNNSDSRRNGTIFSSYMDQNMIFGNLDENDWKCQNSFLNDGK